MKKVKATTLCLILSALAVLMLGCAIATALTPEEFTTFTYWWFIFLFASAGIFYGTCVVVLWRKLRQPW